MRPERYLLILVALAAGCAQEPPPAAASEAASTADEAERFRADARSIEPLVNAVYAYPERLPAGLMPISERLRAEAEAVLDRRSLLRFAERALLVLADHHAITGSSFPDSWAVVPSFADLWVEHDGGEFVIEAVRRGSPAERAGIRAGDRLAGIDGVPTARTVQAFWAELGLDGDPGGSRAAFAARVLAAGRRNATRRLTIGRDASVREVELPNLYAPWRESLPPVTSRPDGDALRIRVNDALGDGSTIGAFDAAMAQARPGQRVIVDLTDTPSGGNTVVARAILGWFVDRPRFYQMHSLPSEQRQTGIARQWVEQVLPRTGRHHDGPVTVEVGRWTGSMGEGLAIGFAAIGAEVVGSRMAGLLGAVYDHRLEHSGLVLKIPTERLFTVDGIPREQFVPATRPPR